MRATPELFAVLGPPHARTNVRAEKRRLVDPVVVLSDAFWRRPRRGAGIVGTAIELDAEPYTVVGVMPRGLRVSDEQDRPNLDAADV